MNATGVRFEVLNKENYDTWKLQMRAVLIKNDAWGYVSGRIVKPEVVEGNEASQQAAARWEEADLKAQSDIVLAISPAEIKQVKGCTSARQIWARLENIYQSKGPARKVALLNHLMSLKMHDDDDAQEHSRDFFDTVDKLAELEVEINKDLLAVLLLRSLPENFENFRCAMSSRDELPSLEILRIKISEEFDARKETDRNPVQNAMAVGKYAKRNSKIKCFKCGVIGHRAKDCKNAKKLTGQSASSVENVSLFVSRDKPEVKVFQTGNSEDCNVWCFDSGCTSHMCKDVNSFVEIDQKCDRGKLDLASKSASIEILGKGTVKALKKVDGKRKVITLNDTLYVPELHTNLVSIGKITDKGHNVLFSKTKAEVIDCDGNVLLTAKREGDLYFLRDLTGPECKNISEADVAERIPKKNSLEDWHVRMGHLNVHSLRQAIRTGSIQGIDVEDLDEDFECSVCLQGKMCDIPRFKESERVTGVGELIHSDVCGLMRVASHAKKRYFVTFVDDASGWCEVQFINHKNEVLDKFDIFRALVDTQQGKKVKWLQSDNGKEYDNANFDKLLQKYEISRRSTVPCNLEQNDVADRRNGALMEMARYLLTQSGLPPTFWAEAVNTANFIRNRSPTSKLNGRTPYEVWFGKPPDVADFKRFGSEVYVLDRSPGKGKIEPRSRKGIFVGYSLESKGYRIWIPEERRVEISRDVSFLKRFPVYSTKDYEDFHPEKNDCLGSLNSQKNVNEAEDNEKCIEIDLVNKHNSDNQINDEEPEILNDVDDEEGGSDVEDFLGFPADDRMVATRRGRPRLVRTGLRGRPRKVYGMACSAKKLDETEIKTVCSSPGTTENLNLKFRGYFKGKCWNYGLLTV